MKQGSGSHVNSGAKREPISRAVDPGGAEQLGNMVIKNPVPLYAGRGYTAPAPVGKTVHATGSQGKHK